MRTVLAPEVRIGDVWRDLDPRVRRTVTVESIHGEPPQGFAKVVSSAGARSRIRLSSFRAEGAPRAKRGFALVTRA